MDGSQFSFHQSQGGIRGERELSTTAMGKIVDSLKIIKEKFIADLKKETNKYFYLDSTANKKIPTLRNSKTDKLLYVRILDQLKSVKNIIISNYNRVDWSKREIGKYEVEIHKKFALPVACFVFMLIGAPLGIMVKKGGFGAAASISMFFFLLYWAFLIGGEKLAERNIFSPFIGMWAANIFLSIVGILLVIRTNKETITIQFILLKKLVPKRYRNEDDTVQNEDT